MEVLNGGYAVEYICYVVDQTNGQESVPASATMAQTNLNGKVSSAGGANAAQDAQRSKTDIQWNSALQVAMPALNGLTDGMAGQVIGRGRQVIRVANTVGAGRGFGAVLGAAAPLLAWGVSELINAYQSSKAENDAIAENIDQTNLRRSMAGLSKINYTRSGLTGAVRMEEYR